MDEIRLAVLGAGKMGGALIRRWVREGVVQPQNLRIRNRRPETAASIANEIGAVAAGSIEEAVRNANCLLVAVKPYAVVANLRDAANAIDPGCLVISVAAGVGIAAVEAALPTQTPLIRVMPNTPALIGAGAAAYCRGTHATAVHAALVERLFGAVGRVVEVAVEDQIDAVTGVSSSGVAFMYLLIEALIDGGVRAGLPRDAARTLAAQTALGAARMILETDLHPAALKDAVTTPGGTTMAGLEVLETAGVRGAVIQAVVAARDRAREMR